MKNSIRPFAVSVFSASLVLTPVEVSAGDDDVTPVTSTVTHASKPKQTNACRARYRDCVKMNQIPSSECQYIYQDCIKQIY